MPEKGNGSLLCLHSHPFTNYSGIKQALFVSVVGSVTLNMEVKSFRELIFYVLFSDIEK